MARLVVFALIAAYIAALSWRAPAGTMPPAPREAVAGDLAEPWPTPDADWSIDLVGVDAADAETAVVAGAVVDGVHLAHAALFRTTDGGASWHTFGPAIPYARFLAVHRDGDEHWIVGHDTADLGGALFTLRSHDSRHWQRLPLPTYPYPQRRLTHARITVIDPDHAVITGAFNGEPGDRAAYVTDDGGQHWTFSRARSAPRFDRDREAITTRTGWSWRLRDGIVERRGPDGQQWIPTRAQPFDGVSTREVPPFTAHR